MEGVSGRPGATTDPRIQCTLVGGTEPHSRNEGTLIVSDPIRLGMIYAVVFVKDGNDLLFTSNLHGRRDKENTSQAIFGFAIRHELTKDSSIVICAELDGQMHDFSIPLRTVSIRPRGPVVHTVEQGEDLLALSMMYAVDPNRIMTANGMTNAAVAVGQQITIPLDVRLKEGESFRVPPGME